MLNRKSIQTVDIKFISIPAIELIDIIFSVSNLDLLMKRTKKINFVIQEEILETLQDIHDELTRFMKRELGDFFDIKFDLGYRLIFKYIVENQDIVSVLSLVESIKKDKAEIISNMISGLYLNKKFETIENFKSDIEASDLDDETKSYLIDFILNVDEVHFRLVKILEYFYEEAYIPMKDDILYILDMEKKKMENNFYYESANFFDKYLSDLSIETEKPIRIHPSFFKQIWKDTLDCKTHFWITLGVYSYKTNDTNLKKKDSLLLYKILSDKTRLEMMMMLSQRSYFVNELAEKLKISSPAVSHHISYLNKLNLVSLKKDDHRFYYYLNKHKLEELLIGSNRLLLGI